LRVLAVHQDVIVFISEVWQTTCTAVRSADEGFLIDSPVYPDELDGLPGVLEQAGFPVSGLLVTHADWDHLLGRQAFPEAALGLSEASAARLEAEPGRAQRDLRRFDEEHYVAGRKPLQLVGLQHLPVPGRLDLGPEQELELHPAPGHTSDGTAIYLPWANVLVAGDYLSPVEIPMVTSIADYRSTLERFRPLVERVETVVPGHGAPMPREQALTILAEDLRYLDDGELPASRRTPTQRRIHAENADRNRPQSMPGSEP
jgi:glyoxylase-like metal-dependent hydrolase (beta-lactamase superfamily II)